MYSYWYQACYHAIIMCYPAIIMCYHAIIMSYHVVSTYEKVTTVAGPIGQSAVLSGHWIEGYGFDPSLVLAIPMILR